MADKKKAGSSLAISAVFYVAVLSALIVAARRGGAEACEKTLSVVPSEELCDGA